jgi:two-component system, sensor histidine kinase and response regulator
VEKAPDEIRTLRRTMRDLVALSALPAVWAGYRPLQVAEGLAEVLLSTLRLDLVYLRLPGQTNGQEIEVARTAGGSPSTDRTRGIGRALAPWLDDAGIDPGPTLPNPVGPGTLRVVVVPIGCGQRVGVLVAGSRQAAFPGEEDRLFLTVGANQAAAVLQRLHAEVALRESEERFRFLVQHSSDIISLFDAAGTVLYQAPSVERLLGWRPQDRIGKNVFRDSIVHPDDLGRKRAFFDALLGRPGAPVKAEFRLRHADGSWRDIEAIGQNFLHAPGVAGIVTNYRDVTERKRTEAALHEINHRLRMVTRATNDAVWDWDLNTNKVWWSEGVLTLFGYRLDNNEADPAWWLERIHPEDRAAVEACFFEVVRGRELYWVDEYRFRCADGSYKDVFDRGYVLRDSEGRAVRMIGAMLDITARKRAEEALRESERRFRTLTEALPHMVWTAEPDGAPDYMNARNTEYTGLTPEQLRGGGWRSTIHPEDVARVLELWTRSTATGELFEAEYRLRRADGAFRWHLSRVLALRDDSGRITKWFGSCVDIDDQKRAQETLRQAKEAAEAANRAKDEFLANVSHEIRTPMNAILGMTELALDTTLTEDQRQCLKTVKSAADNLLGLLNDLLDFSKIEAGKLQLDPADFSLRAEVGDTLRALAARAHKKGLELACQVQPDVPDALVGDAGRLRQVLLNLVGNAIKFTEEGEVVVRVEAAGDPAPAGEASLRFCVSDTGIGIPPEKQEAIFRAFEQEDTSTTRKYGGTGLGLSIAARLVALMGGQIRVDSAPGRGSTFAFTARFGLQPHPPETAARPPALLRGLRVLVVDDNATNRHILQQWLRDWQIEAEAAGDGLAALNALWHAVSLGRPHALVLLDARMPDTDGLALAAQIRKQPPLSAARIILLTSGDRPGDWERLRALHIDGHLLKPVQPDELLETIYRVMGRAGGDAPPAATPARERELALAPVPAAAPLRVLVAEDNEFNAQLLEQLLVRRGHRVRLASDGRQALALAEEGGFDLLLLDVHMPELDGFQVIRAVRQRERSAGGHLPVLALTARAGKEDRERCLAAGMDDFLSKPIRAADLWAAMDRVVGGRRPADPLGPGLLDPRAVLAACGGDDAILGKICQAFRSRLPEELAAVQDALRGRDAPRLCQAAHKLWGMVAAFSTAAGGVASELEDYAAQDRLDEARPLVGQLETMAWELMRLAGGLSLDALRDQAGGAGNPDPAAGP